MDELHTYSSSEVSPSASRKLSRVVPGENITQQPIKVVISMADNESDSIQQEELESKEKQKKMGLLCSFKCRKKIRSATSYIQDYCGNTSLHGLKYMGEERRPLIERICWIIAFGLSIFACSQVILRVWKKWQLSPVIVSFDDSTTPVWQIPFPAVTICPEVKYKMDLLKNSLKKDEERNGEFSLGKSEKKVFPCNPGYSYYNSTMKNDTEVIQFIQEIAPPCNTIISCHWSGKSTGCCGNLFRPLLTEEGVCFTFNMVETKQLFSNNMTIEGFDESANSYQHVETWSDWNAQDGYSPSASIDTYPKRGPGAGIRSGLHVDMQADDFDYDANCNLAEGFKVLLHNPSEFPRMSQQFFRAPLNQDVVIRVKPNILSTSYELQDYPSTRRRCLFQQEKQLQFFTYYTQQNCKLECLVNATLNDCQCMMFFMPSHNYSICRADSLSCASNVEERLQRMDIVNAMNIEASTAKKSIGCNCLPACTELRYDAETSMADFDFKKTFQNLNNVTKNRLFSSVFKGKKFSRLSIFFKEEQFLTSRRGELYGQTDFLANCGGLLGLFMGFSFLSLVELIYFFTLRLFNNLRRLKQKKK